MTKKRIILFAVVFILLFVGSISIFATTNADSQSDQLLATGDELNQLTEDDNDDDDLDLQNYVPQLTVDQAKQIALNSVTNGTFLNIHLEDEDGVIVYNVEIQVGNSVYEVKVDSNNGNILKTEQGDEEEENKDQQNDDDQEQENDGEFED